MKVVHEVEGQRPPEEPVERFVWGVRLNGQHVAFTCNGVAFMSVGPNKSMDSWSDTLTRHGFYAPDGFMDDVLKAGRGK